MTEQNDEAGNTETASEEERVAFFGDVRTKELERLASTLNKQVDNAENHDVQAKPSIITEENIKYPVEIEALDAEETASEEEREAFFQSIRDAERKKIVEAFEKEKIWKEEREERREKKRQERYPSSSNTEYNIILKASVSKLHKRVQAFAEEQKDLQRKLEQSHAIKLRADTEENKENRHISIRTSSDAEILLADRINDVKRTGSVRRFVSRIFKRSKSATAELNSKQVDPEELKLDLTLLDNNKEKEREAKDHPDTARSSNSEWYTLSDIEDPTRPRFKPVFTPLQETHETRGSKLSGSTNHKVAESINPFLLNEPTKRPVPNDIPVHKQSGSTSENSLNFVRRFRKWFRRLCCCCSQNAEDRDTICS
ncbi:uncharacterized protein LOC143078180 [Mytilus galloprovincialis]|uniref:uncharacterized protein LOC143078180 n=1 Tax=Mytilus galloprovincialis TaxID=29158 RepID=UPI003F7C0A23